MIDENFNADVIHAVRRAAPELDILTAAEAELRHAPDEMILERAAVFDRVVKTSDVQTMVGFARRRIAASESMPGLIVDPMYVRVRVLVEDLSLLAMCLTPAEIAQQVRRLRCDTSW